MMASVRVLIRGEGVAACCCMRLLERRGVSFGVEKTVRTKLPAILIGERTQKLISDVFDQPGLFEGLPRIRKRIVKWGTHATPSVFPHEAVLVSEQALLERIETTPAEPYLNEPGEPAWTLNTSRLPAGSAQELSFGSRIAEACRVKLRAGCERDACWIESLDCGWLFLIPAGESGWLLSVGTPAEQLLAKSSLIAEEVVAVDPVSGSFPSHPRISSPLCGPGWMACGTAALGFDPLCGDGTGNATREAILASAVVGASIQGMDSDSILAHYQARLQAALLKHLAVSQEFYRSGGDGPWWNDQVEASRRGIRWCRAQLEGVGAVRYRLREFSLEEIDAVSATANPS